jgi:endonuclease/exonuclease/phosphatase (EEP) superfamily protein YafD
MAPSLSTCLLCLPAQISILLWLVSTIACLATVLGFLGRLWWRFELLSHFRLQYFIFLAACSLIFLLAGQLIGLLLSFLFSLANLALILPLYHRKPARDQNSQSYRLVLSNVLGHNQQYDKILDFIHSANPDLMILIEVQAHLMDALQPILDHYPYTYPHVRDDNSGLALLSSLPLQSVESRYFGDAEKPSIVARLHLDGKLLTVIGTHPPPPKRRFMTDQRNRQMLDIAHFAADQTGEVLLVGDLNMTSWSYSFQDLLQHSRLHDSRLGFGIQPTWPMPNLLLAVPIDHVLHTPGVYPHRRHTGPLIGSDHLPVILDFSL